MSNRVPVALLILLVAALAIAVAYGYFIAPLESDDSMSRDFSLHRQDLDQLVDMLNEDRGLSILTRESVLLGNYSRWRNGSEGFTTERWNAYKLLLDRVGLRLVRREFDRGDEFFFGTESVAYDDVADGRYVISKAYFYSTSTPSPLVGSLDDKGFDTYGTYYRRISGNWYLRFDAGVNKPE